MLELVLFSVGPLAALLGAAAYTLGMAYRLRDWRPVLFAAVLVVMAVHQGNEIAVFLGDGGPALSGFGEYPETAANLLASAAAVFMLRFVDRERTLADRLEALVEARTDELESFAYSVSHDLRTPLRAIDGYTQLLQANHADGLDSEGHRLLRLVSQNTRRMGTLIDDLLTLSRLGRREMEPAAVDLAALARETFAECRDTHPSPCDPQVLTVDPLPVVRADRALLRHVFANLFDNALTFTCREEQPRIHVGTTTRRGQRAVFVRDNGVGFDMQYAGKIFEVFERLHDDLGRDGTGVGLAIVERIVHRHGGAVWAESREGEGTTVYFTLPDDTTEDDD
jgi:light-regulated signal transduction histidine kinase (bacteriophytochrome)